MADPTPMQILQQNEMLREIRDELRISRLSGAAAPGAATGGSSGPRAGSSYLQAQILADRALVGEWGSFGWAQAYQTNHQTSLLADVMAVSGLSRAPNSLYQSEYESLASSTLATRIATMPGYMVAPGFMRRGAQLGANFSAASPRMLRFGSNEAGPLGFGASPYAAHSFGRQQQAMAARDMLLSGSDYNSVFSSGAGSGQFDFDRSISDVSRTFSELRSATAALTRSMRMSVEEVGQTLGALRQYGVRDVADQTRTALQIDARAKVAGVSSQEAMISVRQAIDGGLAVGVGAMGSSVLGMNNLMSLRGMTRDGLISTAVAAAGGGTAAIANTISQAQLGFAGSNLGYYAARGGGGDFFSSLNHGIAGASSLSGFLSAEAGRIDFLSKRSGAAMQHDFNQYIDAQLGVMGFKDTGSEDAQNMAMQFAMASGMDSASALAFGRRRGTAGRFSSARDRYLAGAAERSRAGQSLYDQDYLNTSLTGRVRQTMASVSGGIADVINGVGDFVSPGAGGAFGLIRGSLEDTRRRIAAGAYVDNLSLSEYSAGLTGPVGQSARGTLTYTPGFGGGIGTVLGSAVGMGAAAGALSLFAPPLGITLGALSLAGGGILGSLGNASDVAVNNPGNFVRASAALSDPSKYNKEVTAALASGGALATNSLFQTLAMSGSSGVRSTEALLSSAAMISKQSGVSFDAVMAALPSAGASFTLPSTYMKVEGASGTSEQLLDKVVGGSLWSGYSGLSEAGGRLATTSGRGALMRLTKAVASGKSEDLLQARIELSNMGVKGDDLTRLISNTKKMGSVDREELIRGLDESSSKMRNVALYRAYAPTVEMLQETADIMGADSTTQSRLRGAFSGYANNPGQLILDVVRGNLSADAQAVIGQTSGMQDVLKISKFKGSSSGDIVKEFFGGNSAYNSVASSIVRESSKMEGPDSIKKALALYLLNPGQYQNPEDKEAAAERKAAHAIGDAALVLRELCERLGIQSNLK